MTKRVAKKKGPKFRPEQVIAIDIYDHDHRFESTRFLSWNEARRQGWIESQVRALTARERGGK